MSNIALPNQVFSSPHYGVQPNGPSAYANSSYNNANSPPAPPASHPAQGGTMGPPSRPADKDKPTDMNELSDVLAGSGVDLREEEANLVRINNSTQESQSRWSNPSINNANVYSQNVPGSRDSFYGSGAFNQASMPYQSPEEIQEIGRKRAERRQAEMKQYHLNNPFLFGTPLHEKIAKLARSEQVAISQSGSWHGQTSQEVPTHIHGPDNHDKLVVLKGQSILSHNAPVAEFISLLSLAAEERLRSILEDAATVAIGRRTGSNGIVPPDLVDIVEGKGQLETANGLPTPGNSAVSPKSNPLKRMLTISFVLIHNSPLTGSYSEVNKPPTPISNGSQTPKGVAVAFGNPVAQCLTASALRERAAEEERLSKRARRAANALLAVEGSKSGTPSAGTSGAGTPSLLSEKAPELDIRKAPSKKEMKKQAEAKVSEAQQHAATNNAMNMALGLGSKKPSWMTGGATSASTNPMRPGVNTSSGSQSKNTTATTTGPGLPKARKFGSTEGGGKGVGIQLRDMITVLEADRKERKALAKAYTKLGRD
ncbi:MAG: hypothetical protein LQ342_006081 [Letrouitia transgressa]|nr:MAG: hypothetical protein LQ342_006081 [Letrouitia transgressa]